MKLLDHLPHGTVTVIAILIGAFLIYESGAINKAVSLTENAANRNSEDVIHASGAFKKQIAFKDKVISAESVKVVKLARSLALLRIQNESLSNTLTLAKTPQDTIKAQGSIITNLTAQNDTLVKKCNAQDTIISACAAEKLLMQMRITVLDSALTKQVASTKCHILIFGCPTRTAAYEFGTATGAIIASIIYSLIH